MRKRLSEIHPIFYRTRILQKRLFRQLADLPKIGSFASEQIPENLPFPIKKHQSLLRRKLGNSAPELQENKIKNLKIACPTIDGILIKPRQTFSFWRQLGEATAQKGYVEGMQLSQGKVVRGVGGGLCQLANLLYWMALHTPLEIIERHHHSFDPFPDENRTLPFGSGAGVFFNYIDLRFYNPTDFTIQIRLNVAENHLKGMIYAEIEPEFSYHVFEKYHRFIKKNEKTFRENEIWREIINRKTGNRVNKERLVSNFAEIKYELSPDIECFCG
jgi:vancomycin resistance protein VanW